MTNEARNKKLRKRRARLKRLGICVDCQKQPVKPGSTLLNKPHVCCEPCLQARRDRANATKVPPLIREIQKAEYRQHGERR